MRSGPPGRGLAGNLGVMPATNSPQVQTPPHLHRYRSTGSCVVQEVLESTKDEVKAPQGVVWRAMWRAHGAVFLRTGLIKLVHDCILFVGESAPAALPAVQSSCRSVHDISGCAATLRIVSDVAGPICSCRAHV